MDEAEERIKKLKENISASEDCLKDVCRSSPDIDGLTLNLAALDLSIVPASLCDTSDLSWLDSLYLDYNDIAELPCGLVLERLTKLSLIGNQLTCLPASVGQLTAMTELYLNENHLVSLPDAITNIKQLSILNIVGNHIMRLPANIGELQQLKQLYADENDLKHLPRTFGELGSLETLELGTNRLVQLPRNFGWLKCLQVLNLSANKLASLPESFAELSCLTELDLSGNNLCLLPPALKAHRSLRKFYVEKNQLEELPDWIGDLPEIVELSLLDNKLKGSPLPENLAIVSSQLKVDDMILCDANYGLGAYGMEFVHNWEPERRRVLDLGGNFISHLPDGLGALKSLESIHLGSVIDELERRNFQNGNWLWSLPDSFGRLESLRYANLDENQLEGLPSNFGDLVHLEWLDLGQNRICGLPASFSKLRSLRVCLLSKNHLELLASDFGDLTKLEDLRLDNNKIAELPESFVNLTQLRTLDLFNNNLTEVPACLQNLTRLVTLDIDQNDFGLDTVKIPQKTRQSMYAPRDPAFKDTWRGRGRQDLCKVEVTKMDAVEGAEDGGVDGATEDLPYTYSALKNAVRRNMSLWKSHDSQGQREVYIHPVQPSHSRVNYGRDDSESSDDDADLGYEDDWQAPPSSSTVPKDSNLEEYGEREEEGEEENWDLELEPVTPISSYVATIPGLSTATRQTTSPDVFVPSEQHAASIQRRPAPVWADDGQFDDVDDDSGNNL